LNDRKQDWEEKHIFFDGMNEKMKKRMEEKKGREKREELNDNNYPIIIVIHFLLSASQ